MIELKSIGKSYYQQGKQGKQGKNKVSKILSNLDLEIKAGEQVAIMGPSGSGKSTLMHILGLLDTPDQGLYRLEGQDVSQLNSGALAKVRNLKIGFIFQSFFLLPEMKVYENIGLPLLYRKEPEAVILDKTKKILKLVQLEDFFNYYPKQLSGGQQQRVAIARALIGEPSLILADEPTGALDQTTGKAILKLFFELQEKLNSTVVMITHDLAVAKSCQRVLWLRDGKLEK